MHNYNFDLSFDALLTDACSPDSKQLPHLLSTVDFSDFNIDSALAKDLTKSHSNALDAAIPKLQTRRRSQTLSCHSRPDLSALNTNIFGQFSSDDLSSFSPNSISNSIISDFSFDSSNSGPMSVLLSPNESILSSAFSFDPDLYSPLSDINTNTTHLNSHAVAQSNNFRKSFGHGGYSDITSHSKVSDDLDNFITNTLKPTHSGRPRSSSSSKALYTCHICSSTFSRRHDLKRHGFFHVGAKPYKCIHCGKGYTRPDAAQKHILKCTDLLDSNQIQIFDNGEIKTRQRSVTNSF